MTNGPSGVLGSEAGTSYLGARRARPSHQAAPSVFHRVKEAVVNRLADFVGLPELKREASRAMHLVA